MLKLPLSIEAHYNIKLEYFLLVFSDSQTINLTLVFLWYRRIHHIKPSLEIILLDDFIVLWACTSPEAIIQNLLCNWNVIDNHHLLSCLYCVLLLGAVFMFMLKVWNFQGLSNQLFVEKHETTHIGMNSLLRRKWILYLEITKGSTTLWDKTYQKWLKDTRSMYIKAKFSLMEVLPSFD